jgi:hypothetical protein
MVTFRTRELLWTLAAALGAAAPAAAQVPNVGFVFPPGGQAGTNPALTLSGGNLQGATAVLVSGEGVKAQITKNTEGGSLPVQLTIDPKAVPGLRELRVVTPRGTSNAGRIWVGGYLEAGEAEPNNTLAAPQKLEKLPVTINGQVNGGEDVDSFTFQAGAGDTYVFDIVAARMASGLDPYLMLLDGRGKHLAYAQEGFDRDPRIIHRFETAGTYTLQVRDTMYRGGGGFVYKLTLGKVPVITSYLPMGGPRGETVELKVEGANLGSMKTMSVAIPQQGESVTVGAETPMGPAVNPITLVATGLYEIPEYEPNDAPDRAYSLTEIPMAVSGRIDRAGDTDLYRIKPAADGNLSFEVHARRIGSRLDSFLRVMDAAGKDLSTNDDAAGKDSRIVLGVKANTEYVIEVRGMDRRYGGDSFYRLEIAPPAAPDFQLSVTPDEINVGQSGSTVVTVNVQRIGGFGGPIALRVDGLPAGVSVSHAMVNAGQNSAQFTLTAAPDAQPGAMGLIRVVGKASVGGAEVERVAQPFETYQPPLAQPNQTANRDTLVFAATVMPPTPFALDIEPKQITVKKGTQNVEIKLKAIRQMGQNAAITIAVAGQPANVAPVLANIEQNKNEAVLKLNVAANAPAVTQNIIITGTVNNDAQVGPALTITVTD